MGEGMWKEVKRRMDRQESQLRPSEKTLRAMNQQIMTTIGETVMKIGFVRKRSVVKLEEVKFVIVKELRGMSLLGTEVLKKFEAIIDFKEEKLRIPGRIEIPVKIRDQVGAMDVMNVEAFKVTPRQLMTIVVQVPELYVKEDRCVT